MKRTLAFLFALLLSIQFISCGTAADDADAESPDSNPAGAESISEETTSEPFALSVGKQDFEGYTVKYLTANAYCEHFKLNIGEENGDTLNDAGYKRELAVGDLLNVEFDAMEVKEEQVQSSLFASVTSGDSEYDLVLPHATVGVAGMVTANLLTDWNTIEHVDFSLPWWNSRMQDSLGIGGKVFYASGDIVMTWQGMGAYLFNKDYIANYSLNVDMYDLVNKGEWTVDKLMSVTKDIYRDLDGDGEATTADQYGILANLGGSSWYQFGCGQLISRPGEDGCPVLDMGSERMVRIVEAYYNMLYSPDTWQNSFSSKTYATSDYREMLISGRSFITFLDIGGLYNYLREIEFDFGILPMAKLNENQESYYSFCGAGLIGVPIGTSAPDRTGMVAEALAYYSYQHIRPAFFEVVLQNKALRDEESYNILTMMHASKVFDFGFNFDSTAANALNTVVSSKKTTDFTSYYSSIEEKVNKNFKTIYDTVMENNQ